MANSRLCYREHWASCSGAIEPGDTNPLERAWAELREETGLTPEELHLLCSGQPQRITDAGIDTQWTIYPFLFEIKAPDIASTVKLDWEHTEYRWIVSEDLSEYQTVPSLEETLQRVVVGDHAIHAHMPIEIHTQSPDKWNLA